MDQPFDLDAYLRRIGFDGPREPTLACLQALHRLHPAAIAFENLDPLLGRPPQLDLGALQAKLVDSARGGYCYEQNLLFKAALDALGFSVTGLAARVMWGDTADAAPRRRSHMLLKVDLDGRPFIADVGFGGLVLTAPLRLQTGIVQETPHEAHRLLAHGEGYALQARLGEDWSFLNAFTLEPQTFGDYEVMNWFTATHPSSPFTSSLIATRATPQGRVSLFDNQLVKRPTGGAVEEFALDSVDALRQALIADFGIAPPDLAPLSGRIGLS